MRKRFFVSVLAGAALFASVSACGDDPLSVPNTNNPDVDRSLGTIGDVQTVISRLYQQMHQGMHASNTSIQQITQVMAFESASALGNFEMGQFSNIPRVAIDNSIGNKTESENFRWYDFLGRNARSASNAITRLDALVTGGATLGSAAANNRAKAFAYFALGFATGHLGMMYDSVAVTAPGLEPEDVSEYVGGRAAVDEALRFLDSAFVAASAAAGQSIPNSGGDAWIITPDAISMARFQQIIRSFQARFLAGSARRPGDLTAADWQQVINYASAGLTSDLVLSLSSGLGWTHIWLSQALVESTWHQMPLFIIGMADTSVVAGVRPYEAWLSAPLTTRDAQAFLIRTPDRRFPPGETRAAQQAFASALTPPNDTLYIRNRTGGDAAAHKEWRFSFYDVIRFGAYRAGNSNGPWLTIGRAETELLLAEAYIETGQVGLAVPLINNWRTRAGLPAIGATNDVNTQVPGGAACVPRVPSAAAPTTTVCGNIREAMKWEKRMETLFAGAASWYRDSRRWGDLVVGTPLEWPAPYDDLLARGKSIYHVGAAGMAGPSSYGFGN